jgi:uncharacterized damage-inducible protein DinB
MMNPAFQKVYDTLKLQRSIILNEVKDVSIENYNRSPAPGKWSLGQILTHILTAERLSIGYMKKKYQGANQTANSGILSSLKLVLLIISQRIPALKFNAPKVVIENTPPVLSLQELIEKWTAQREDLRLFLDEMDEKNYKKLIYKHPIAGRLDTRQEMVFFREHIIHHVPQIKRLVNQK